MGTPDDPQNDRFLPAFEYLLATTLSDETPSFDDVRERVSETKNFVSMFDVSLFNDTLDYRELSELETVTFEEALDPANWRRVEREYDRLQSVLEATRIFREKCAAELAVKTEEYGRLINDVRTF